MKGQSRIPAVTESTMTRDFKFEYPDPDFWEEKDIENQIEEIPENGNLSAYLCALDSNGGGKTNIKTQKSAKPSASNENYAYGQSLIQQN